MYCGEELRKEELQNRVHGDFVYNSNQRYNYFVLKATEHKNGFYEKFVYGDKSIQCTKETNLFWTKVEKKVLHDDTRSARDFIQSLPVGISGSFSYRYEPTKTLSKHSLYYYEKENIVVDICVPREWCQDVYAKAQTFAEKLLDRQTDLLDEFIEKMNLDTVFRDIIILEIRKDSISNESFCGHFVYYSHYNMQNLEDIIHIYGLALALCKKLTDIGFQAKIATDYQHVYIEIPSNKKLNEW